MIRTSIVLALALLVTACAPAAPRPLDAYVAGVIPDGAGVTALAARDGELVYCRGFGFADRAAKVKASCDTVYDVMSITKQFTAAAILKLESMGELSVRDPIGRHLGRVPADKRSITLHHLLTHTAGLVEAVGDDYAPVSRRDVIRKAMATRLRSTPGKAFRYSNVGYSLLAAVVEKVSGLGYEEFLAKHLFRPAGMADTGYVLPRWDRKRVAVEYDAQGVSHGRPYDHPWAADGPHWNLRGNGGILSTARDMFRWHRALSGDDVLSAKARTALFTAYTEVPDSPETYGYGWALLDNPYADGRIAWHDGGNDWSMANFARTLSDDTVVFWATNQVTRDGRWNLDENPLALTFGMLDRVRE